MDGRHIYMAWKIFKESAIYKQLEEKLNEADVWLNHKIKYSEVSIEDEFIEICSHLFFLKKTGSYIFVDENKGIRKYIIKEMDFIDFPGIENEKEISKISKIGKRIVEGALKPNIYYGCDFELLSDGRILMEWTLQPDGRYWEDEDGFGGTNDIEITLYSHIDINGNFVEPFKIIEYEND